MAAVVVQSSLPSRFVSRALNASLPVVFKGSLMGVFHRFFSAYDNFLKIGVCGSDGDAAPCPSRLPRAYPPRYLGSHRRSVADFMLYIMWLG